MIRLDKVTKIYREGDRQHRVLDRADLHIARGEFVILLGRSGSGKSTLLNLLSGIDLPTSGDIRIGGESLPTLSDRHRTLLRRRAIGFVFQSFNLIPTLTVEENVLLPLELKTGKNGRAERQRSAAMLEEVGLAHRATSYPDRLSGGEQQRVAVARALIHEPDIVLADEPTGNLDLDTGRRVVELLDRLTRAAGKTMVMATHSLEVAGLADHIYHLVDGKFVAAESPPP